MNDVTKSTKVQIQSHLKDKSDEELQKGYEALYEQYLRGKTKLQLVETIMEHTKQVDWTRDLLVSEIVRIQLAMMFGE